MVGRQRPAPVRVEVTSGHICDESRTLWVQAGAGQSPDQVTEVGRTVAGRASQRGHFNGRAPPKRANCFESHTPVGATRTILTGRSRTGRSRTSREQHSQIASVGPLLVPVAVEVGEHVGGQLLQGRPRVISSVSGFGTPWLSASIKLTINCRPRSGSR